MALCIPHFCREGKKETKKGVGLYPFDGVWRTMNGQGAEGEGQRDWEYRVGEGEHEA